MCLLVLESLDPSNGHRHGGQTWIFALWKTETQSHQLRSRGSEDYHQGLWLEVPALITLIVL